MPASRRNQCSADVSYVKPHRSLIYFGLPTSGSTESIGTIVKKIIIAVALAAAPFTSFASESNGIGYTNVELGYAYEDIGGYYGNGAKLSGSYAFTDNFFVTGTYARTTDDYSESYGSTSYDVDQTVTHWTVGVGFNKSIGTRADWVSQLAYARFEDEDEERVCTVNECTRYTYEGKINGYNLSTGVRGRITDKVTANAYLGYEDYNHGYDGNFYADFAAGYSFSPTWSIESGVRLSSGAESWNLGVRASF